MRHDKKNIEEVLARALPSASRQQMEAARDRVLARLRSERHRRRATEGPLRAVAKSQWRPPIAAAAAAMLVTVLVSIGIPFRDRGPYAVLEAADNSLYRITDGARVPIRVGDRIAAQQTLQTNGGAGAVVALADGSRIEIGARSEMWWDRADGGLMVRLNAGGIIVTAATEGPGRLYVQTKDITALLTHTTSLVYAAEDGSRVAVIEGEAQVREGALETKLRSGEDLATSPTLGARSLPEAIAWSRNAGRLLALLVPAQPPVLAPTTTHANVPATALPMFDVASIRRNIEGGVPRMRAEAGRFVASNISLRELILHAYGIESFQVVGGPDWWQPAPGPTRAAPASQRSGDVTFDVIANIPQNAPAAQVPLMLRRLLAERFNLVVHTEMRDMPVYLLTYAGSDKRLGPQLTRSTQQCEAEIDGAILRAPVTRVTADGKPLCGMMLSPASIRGGGLTIRFLAHALTGTVRRLVIDRTGLEGPFDFHLTYAPASRGGGPAPSDDRPSIFTAVQEQLKLKLDAATAPVEVVVVDAVSTPTEN
jgi:uncharacterized protein (TIGR03435 family)